MAKGFFTQAAVILFQQDVTIDAIKPLLNEFNVVKEVPAGDNWVLSGPSLVVEYREKVNGYVSIDVVDHRWPDHMGDPKEESMLFGAWTTGNFGPYAYPNGLARSSQHSWRWKEGKTITDRHKSFVRIRMSYIFGASADSPVMPEDCNMLDELQFISHLSLALLRHEDALCYFNPNGEVLISKEMLEESIRFGKEHGVPPLDIWTNIRLFNITNDWALMDSVGCWQLDIPDHEVAFPIDAFSPQEVDPFIRNVTLYIMNNGMVINDGDTVDGPGGRRWQGRTFENGISDPPRQVLRWLPTGVSGIPPALIGEEKEEDIGQPVKKPKKWKFWKR